MFTYKEFRRTLCGCADDEKKVRELGELCKEDHTHFINCLETAQLEIKQTEEIKRLESLQHFLD